MNIRLTRVIFIVVLAALFAGAVLTGCGGVDEPRTTNKPYYSQGDVSSVVEKNGLWDCIVISREKTLVYSTTFCAYDGIPAITIDIP